MQQRSIHRMTPQLVFGVIILALGVVFTLDHLEVLNARDFIRYWPVLLIVYGISRIGDRTRGRGGLAGFFFLGVGALLLLKNLDLLSFRIWDYWPVILVVIGSMLVFRAFGRRRSGGEESAPGESSSRVNAFVMFGGVARKNSSQDFKGGEITAVMGGCELDLRQASIKDKEAVIDVFAFWGGIDIKVPEDWTVSIDSMPLMGGCEDKTRPPKEDQAKHLVVRGYVIMGGLEIGQ